jgi:uncharacterized phage protein (TIGR02218 family)
MSGTTGRVTQSLVEVADSGGAGTSRATQVLAEALYNEVTTARVTQVTAEALYDFPTSARVTQVVGEVLYLDSVAGRTVSTACLLWRLTRRDGTVMRFAALDVDVTYGGQTFLAAAPFETSASELVRTLSPGQVEVAGLIDHDTISPTDILNGLFDGARVEVFRVNWSSPAGGAEVLTAGVLGAVSTGDLRFEAEAETPAALLRNQVTGTVTPACRWTFGDSRCGVNLATVTESHSITAVASRKQFTASGFGQPAGWANRGKLVFTSGPNAGAERDIRSHASGGVITLWEDLAVTPTVGDGFDITAGCNRTTARCIELQGNLLNFGGYPQVKGDDSASRYPDAR